MFKRVGIKKKICKILTWQPLFFKPFNKVGSPQQHSTVTITSILVRLVLQFCQHHDAPVAPPPPLAGTAAARGPGNGPSPHPAPNSNESNSSTAQQRRVSRLAASADLSAEPPAAPASGGPDRNALLGDIRAGMKLKPVSSSSGNTHNPTHQQQQVALPQLTNSNTSSIENQLRNMISARRQAISDEPADNSEDDWSDGDS